MQTQPASNRDIECARQVISQEIAGLESVMAQIDARFIALVDLIVGIKGRLIISGMGKSGHIARKIAATMASTGTPAHFVHPSEASHGDLGVITKDDAVMLLSNSGETAELQDIIAFTRRFSIPLVAMVRRETSMLVDAADIAIILPEVAEASPIGAPTTSTIMMLAYGDALAIALLERRGFTREDFNNFHPGGRLGKTFIKVASLMHQDDELPLIPQEEGMDSGLIEMTAKRFGCVGAIDERGRLMGIVTDGDLRRHMTHDLLKMNVGAVMTVNPLTIHPDMLAVEALGIMNDKNITCLFVTDEDKRPVGILHIHDCLRAGVM